MLLTASLGGSEGGVRPGSQSEGLPAAPNPNLLGTDEGGKESDSRIPTATPEPKNTQITTGGGGLRRKLKKKS